MLTPAQQAHLAKLQVVQQTMLQLAAPVPPVPPEPPRRTHCSECGAALPLQWDPFKLPSRTSSGQVCVPPHLCAQPDAHDLEVVRTIQALAAQGLSPDEIAGDMGVVVGWRMWEASVLDRDALYGIGVGSVPWHFDRPMVAVCADSACCGDSVRCRMQAQRKGYPMCRVHALKPGYTLDVAGSVFGHVIGQVALWGEVQECDRGWIATRAYPLALDSELWARAYRVPTLRKGER